MPDQERVGTPEEFAEALRRSEERYRAFVQQSSEGVWRFEVDPPVPTSLPEAEQIAAWYERSRLAECNEAMARMYGFPSADELVGCTLGDLLDPAAPASHEYLAAFLQSGYRLTDVESEERDADGQPKYFLNSLIGVIEDGHLTRVWGTQRDVTDLKSLEAQLRQAQKMEAIGRLAGGVAHDFNNILTVILANTELLLQPLREEDPLYRDLQELRKAAQRGASLTQQLLAMSRKQLLQPAVLDLREVVSGMQALLVRLIGEDVELVTRTADDVWAVKADRGQLEQVITNLAVNARDAMPQGGTLTIEVANVMVSHELALIYREMKVGPHVLLAVSDTGVGMDDETRSHAFEPFFTTKPSGKGTGLGLSTTYGIVKQSGGWIYVESEVGSGSTFRIYLPRAEAAAVPRASGGVRRPTEGGGETVLVVEDDDVVRRLAVRILTNAGYEVLEAADGPEALDRARRHDGPIDLLVADVVMPGLSGRQVAEALEAERPSMRVLFMSGHTDDATVRHGVSSDLMAYLQKPFTPEALAAKVREVLEG